MSTPTQSDTMTRCISGPDLVVGYEPAGITLYSYDRDGVEHLGRHLSIREAWHLIDDRDLR